MKLSRILLLLLLVAGRAPGAQQARNVILFLGDAGGISTLHAASIHGHNDPQALFIQHLPHIGLSETSSADRWVTDSAAGMTAIVTGQKTKSGVLSESAEAVPQKHDGTILRTVLEHAEARGLSTGVITNMSLADATPAACYAHQNYRKDVGQIIAQLAAPRLGDGVDVAIGGGREAIYAATKPLGVDLEAQLHAKGYLVTDDPAQIPAGARRVVAITDHAFDPLPVVRRAVEILAENRAGYFLMVEWDLHATNARRGLDHVLEIDALVKQTANQVGPDTLILFTADHSFDLRVRGGLKGEPLLPPDLTEPVGEKQTASTAASLTGGPVAEPRIAADQVKPTPANVRVDDGHTGEQVLVAAQGPGAERVHGFMLNTDLFHVMMSAYGWE